MARSQRYNAFSPNPNFAIGQTLQRPVAGAIPRGFLPLHYNATETDALRAGAELRNPFPASDSQALQRGAFVFANFCRECHGPAGRGDGAVALRVFPAPPPLQADKAVKMKDGQMFHVLAYGQDKMPSYAAQLDREDRWKAILFLRTLQVAPEGKP